MTEDGDDEGHTAMSTVVARGTARRLGLDRPRDEGAVGGVDWTRQAILRLGTGFKAPIVEAPALQVTAGCRSRQCARCGYWQATNWHYGVLGSTVHVCERDGATELITWGEA